MPIATISTWSLQDEERKKILSRHIPELTESEILSYMKIENDADFLPTVIKTQTHKNSLPIEKSLLNEDVDFKCLSNDKDGLFLLDSDFCTNKNIVNFVSNHATNIILDYKDEDKGWGINWSKIWITKDSLGLNIDIKSLGAEVRIPPVFFDENDITFNPDGIYFKNYFLPLHSVLKQLKSFRIEFLETFWKFRKQNIIFKICIDPHYAVCLDNYRRIALDEWLYHWRPYSEDALFVEASDSFFSKYISDDLLKIDGENKIPFTEVFLDQKEWSLQIEEISNITDENWFYMHRYIHCFFNREKRLITHFDWAILLYDEECHQKRLTTTLDKRIKYNIKHKKLFKIDWNPGLGIDIQSWKSLILSFFIGNEIVMSFIDKELYEKSLEDKWSDYSKFMEDEMMFIERIEKEPHKFVINTQFHFWSKEDKPVHT